MTGSGEIATLLAWLSAGFPTGAFAWSHGLEEAVAAGRVADAAALADWLADALEHGAGRTDAILAAHAHRAAGRCEESAEALEELARLARALQPTAERLAETEAQGAAFAHAVAAWGVAVAPAPLPVALGAAAGLRGIPADALLPATLQSFAATLVSAGVRLIPLGQAQGQRVLAALQPLCLRLAAEAAAAPLEAIGSAAFALDIAAARHETLPVRLFRS